MRAFVGIREIMVRGQAFRHSCGSRLGLLFFVLLSGVALLGVIAWQQVPLPYIKAATAQTEKRSASFSHVDENSTEVLVERAAHPEPQGFQVSGTPESLEASFDRLAANADSGDRVSACLLSRALALCEEAETLSQEGSYWIGVAASANAASSDEHFAINKVVGFESIAGNASAVCKGLSPGHLSEAGARMLQAAELGDPRAMTHFALYSRPSDKGRGMKEKFDEAYRKHAVAMLQRSASMGNLRALRSLYEVYLHGVSPNRDDTIRIDKDHTAAIAIGTALLNKASAHEKQYILSTFDQIENASEIRGSQRYMSLQKKYYKYVEEISLNGFDESGKNLDIGSCDKSGRT